MLVKEALKITRDEAKGSARIAAQKALDDFTEDQKVKEEKILNKIVELRSKIIDQDVTTAKRNIKNLEIEEKIYEINQKEFQLVKKLRGFWI